jgi:hypothetical protein
MIELKSTEQMRRAIENARANRKHLVVRMTNVARQYIVFNKNTNGSYLTSFDRKDGKRYGSCTCKAGQLNRICKHIAAAAALNICLAERGYFSRMN